MNMPDMLKSKKYLKDDIKSLQSSLVRLI